ncbi:hypothetical protein EJA70_04150 [Pseudomonas sp. PB103]|nr:hypothetical protein EJA70_04150 [Pseudomonas sp. PB103]
MNVSNDWKTLGERASEDLIARAAFVAQTEFLWQDTAVKDADVWQRLWFELEIRLRSRAVEKFKRRALADSPAAFRTQRDLYNSQPRRFAKKYSSFLYTFQQQRTLDENPATRPYPRSSTKRMHHPL